MAVFGFEFLQQFALLGDDGFQGFFEVFFSAGGGMATGCGDWAEGVGELGVVSGGEILYIRADIRSRPSEHGLI